MLRFILNRLASMALTLLVISILVFFIAEVVPVDPARHALGRYATEEAVQDLRDKMGLDRPAVERYADWITGIFRGDFGISIHSQRPVRQLIGVRLMRSLTLAALGFIFMMPTGLLLGSIAGINEGKPIDRILSLMGGIFVSIPPYASGIFLIVIFALWLGWFPGVSLPDPEDTVGKKLIKQHGRGDGQRLCSDSRFERSTQEEGDIPAHISKRNDRAIYGHHAPCKLADWRRRRRRGAVQLSRAGESSPRCGAEERYHPLDGRNAGADLRCSGIPSSGGYWRVLYKSPPSV